MMVFDKGCTPTGDPAFDDKKALKNRLQSLFKDPANEGSLQTPGDTLKSPIASLVSR